MQWKHPINSLSAEMMTLLRLVSMCQVGKLLDSDRVTARGLRGGKDVIILNTFYTTDQWLTDLPAFISTVCQQSTDQQLLTMSGSNMKRSVSITVNTIDLSPCVSGRGKKCVDRCLSSLDILRTLFIISHITQNFALCYHFGWESASQWSVRALQPYVKGSCLSYSVY